MANGKRKVASTALGVAVFLLGSAVLLYPEIDSCVAQRSASEMVSDAMGKDARDADAQATEGNGRAKSGDPAYRYLLHYNEKVRNGNGGAINDPWGIGADVSGLEGMGLEEDVIGSITIPRLDETLPLLLNATTDHMAVGATVISGTSAPLGGQGDNCVIAAHRSVWHGLRMFRDIEDMELGDLLTIDTLWDSLTYRVVETKVISSDDADALRPQAGRDLVTLFTCHPYRHNYQRYLVICERVQEGGTQEVPRGIARLVVQAANPSDSPDLVMERWIRVGGLLMMLVMVTAGVVVLVGSSLRGRRGKVLAGHARGNGHAKGMGKGRPPARAGGSGD